MNKVKNKIVDNKKIMKKNENKLNRDKLIKEYLKTFDEKDQLAYKIAQEHLQSSFCLEKSIGFNKWLKDRKK